LIQGRDEKRLGKRHRAENKVLYEEGEERLNQAQFSPSGSGATPNEEKKKCAAEKDFEKWANVVPLLKYAMKKAAKKKKSLARECRWGVGREERSELRPLTNPRKKNQKRIESSSKGKRARALVWGTAGWVSLKSRPENLLIAKEAA